MKDIERGIYIVERLNGKRWETFIMGAQGFNQLSVHSQDED